MDFKSISLTTRTHRRRRLRCYACYSSFSILAFKFVFVFLTLCSIVCVYYFITPLHHSRRTPPTLYSYFLTNELQLPFVTNERPLNSLFFVCLSLSLFLIWLACFASLLTESVVKEVIKSLFLVYFVLSKNNFNNEKAACTSETANIIQISFSIRFWTGSACGPLCFLLAYQPVNVYCIYHYLLLSIFHSKKGLNS